MAPSARSTVINFVKIQKTSNRKVHLVTILSLIFVIFTYHGVESGRIEQRDLAHISTKAYRCAYAKYKSVQIGEECSNGSYRDSCGRHVCYKDVIEECDENAMDEIHGKCTPGLTCSCGKCMGCTKIRCGLELICNRGQVNKFFEKFSEFVNGDYTAV